MKLLVSVLFLVCLCDAQRAFPDDFLFGTATASYQIEGAWNANEKGVNIWDHITHTNPSYVANGDNGDIACDAYHKTDEDVQLLRSMGVDFYRFSLSWSRILPTGYDNVINPDGVRYYSELIDALLANDITPLVTIYHWDLPQPLQEIGGWPSPLLADLYADYANIVFSLFGDRVKDWITFNEPYQICQQGYSLGTKAPGYTQDGIGGYMCAHTLLLAHAKAYRIYEENYKEDQGGRVGITYSTTWHEPNTDSVEDQEAAETASQFYLGWYAHPVFSDEGDYPPIMRERIDALSAEEGFPKSRLPTFSPAEIELIKGSADFFGLNHYTTNLVKVLDINTVARPSNAADAGASYSYSEDWEMAASSWLAVYPEGLRKQLNWIKDEYNNPEVIITENGFSDSTPILADCRRINYINSYLEALLDALDDGCHVTGYTIWSFMDNFEWKQGYTERFGVHSVDFDDPERTRTPKMSSYVYKNIIATGQIDWDYKPEGFEACEWE